MAGHHYQPILDFLCICSPAGFPSATKCDFLSQPVSLKIIQALVSTLTFPLPQSAERHELSITVLSDAELSATNGQLCYVAELLLSELFHGCIFHTLSWSSYKAKRPVLSIRAAEILAAVESIDEGKILAMTMSLVVSTHIPLHVVLYFKDLYTSLFTHRNSVYKSIRADFNCIRFAFERRKVVRIIWVPTPGPRPKAL